MPLQPGTTDLMGGSPAQRPERYRAGSPIELVPFGVRQELFAGRMFAAQAAPYEAATTRAGDPLRLTLLANAGHFLFIESAIGRVAASACRGPASRGEAGTTLAPGTRLGPYAITRTTRISDVVLIKGLK